MGTKTVWVTGGAGYLGGSTALLLKDLGYHPIVLDRVAHKTAGIESVLVDLADWTAAERKLSPLPAPAAVIHFAALALVGESWQIPTTYFRNNLLATIHTAELASRHGKLPFVHSSSCSVYGITDRFPIPEDTPYSPLSPYGETKKAAEGILNQYQRLDRLRVLNLRYFNPAGAFGGGRWGERHDPETHAIPRVVAAAALKQPFEILGTDYPTADGTCIRDYIHVEDLAQAHIAALEALGGSSELPAALNLGTGTGYSVRQLVDTARSLLGDFPVLEKPRRPGDAPRLVADPTAAQRLLKWRATRGLDAMIRSHFEFAHR